MSIWASLPAPCDDHEDDCEIWAKHGHLWERSMRRRTMIEVSPAALDLLLECAVRYALGRRSYIVAVVCDTVAAYADDLSPDTRARLAHEITDHLAGWDAPADLIVRWQHLADRLAEKRPEVEP